MVRKFYSLVVLFVILGKISSAQFTAELPTFSGSFGAGLQGPSTAPVGPIPMMQSDPTNLFFNPLTGPDLVNVKMTLSNQQYTGLTYSNITTGLAFGAQPTVATGGTVQGVDQGNIYDNLGSFVVSPGGPLSSMFTSSASVPPIGSGIVSGSEFSVLEPNGAVFLFTNAQLQYDRPGGPSVHNTATRYYYGDLVIDFNRFIANPVLHIAGLGGSYRYFPISGTNQLDPTQWRSSYFSTELEVVGLNASRLSGNSNFTVAGSSITNSAARPSGASVSTLGGLFDEFGAASGSVRIVGTVKTIVLRIYLRGSDNSNFAWSAIGKPAGPGDPAQQVFGGTRNPMPGDIWSVSVSASQAELITLPATGMTLTGSLDNDNVSLNWKTLSEIDTKQFEVERSTDGTSFSTIATKAAAGNSLTTSTYTHTDNGMHVPVYYYRIKLVDINGKITYSNTIVIRRTNGSVKQIKTFPNPVQGHLNIEFSNMKGNFKIALYNTSGQLVQSQQSNISAAVQYVAISRGSLSSGTYTLQVINTASGETTVQKVVLQ